MLDAMIGRFPPRDAADLLVKCHRRCCICHRWCGTKIEIDHIVPVMEGGPDTIENAIAICFNCHAEAHAYNPKHPRGRKFTPEELRAHKGQWLEICRSRPEMLVGPTFSDVGPVQALVDELEVNRTLAGLANDHPIDDNYPPPYWTKQFERAMNTGSLAVLYPELRDRIAHAYAAIAKANQAIARAITVVTGGETSSVAHARAVIAVRSAKGPIDDALDMLYAFLGGSESVPANDR